MLGEAPERAVPALVVAVAERDRREGGLAQGELGPAAQIGEREGDDRLDVYLREAQRQPGRQPRGKPHGRKR